MIYTLTLMVLFSWIHKMICPILCLGVYMFWHVHQPTWHKLHYKSPYNSNGKTIALALQAVLGIEKFGLSRHVAARLVKLIMKSIILINWVIVSANKHLMFIRVSKALLKLIAIWCNTFFFFWTNLRPLQS